MDKEGVVTAIKHFILPELKEIKDNQARMSRALEQKTAHPQAKDATRAWTCGYISLIKGLRGHLPLNPHHCP